MQIEAANITFQIVRIELVLPTFASTLASAFMILKSGFRFADLPQRLIVCSGSVVVTAYDFESGCCIGSNPDWG